MITQTIKNKIPSFSNFLFHNSLINSVSIFHHSMTIDEALKILNIKDRNNITPIKLNLNYKNLISRNDPYKSGSFYLQNKIYNAKEKLSSTIKHNFSYKNTYNKFKIYSKNYHI